MCSTSLILVEIAVFNAMFAVTCVKGVAMFTQTPANFTAVPGQDVEIVWKYNVTDKKQEFAAYSPIWSFNSQDIGFDNGFSNRQWTIANTCPPQFKSPLRIFKKDNATLVIKNVSSIDSGTYTCKLDLKSGTDPESSVLLMVREPATTAATTTATSNVTDSTAIPATSTAPASSATTPSTTGEVDALTDGAIAGIVVAVVAVIVVAIVLVVWRVKKNKGKGKGIRIPMSDS